MNNNQNYINLIYKIASIGIMFVITMIITKIVVYYLGQEIYGYYDLSNDFVNYASIISVALNSMASRYITISYYSNKDDLNCYFNSVLFSNIILAISLIVPFFLLVLNLNNIININYEYIIEIKILFALMLINFLLSIITSIFSVATFTKNRVDLDSQRQIECWGIRLIIIIVFYFLFDPHIWYLGVGVLISNFYVFFRNYFYTVRLLPEIKISIHYFKFSYVKELIVNGIWNSFTKIGSVLLTGLDLFISNLIISPAAMGILSLSKTIPKYILNSMGSLSSVFSPSLTISYAQKDNETLKKVLDNSMRINIFIMIIIVTFMLMYGETFFIFWIPNVDSKLIHIITIITISSYTILMPLESLWSIYTVTNKVKVSSIYLTLEAAIRILIVYIFIRFFSTESDKIFFLVGTTAFFEIIRGLFFLPITISSYVKIKIKFFYIRLLRGFICLSITCFIVYVLPEVHINVLFDLFFGALKIVIIASVVCALFLLNKDEKSNLKIFISKRRIK